MKNLVMLASKNEIDDYVLGLWKSDIFRDSHLTRGYVWEHVRRFALLPRLFAEETNDHLERAHFSTWWNVIMIRDDYTNPIIHDLYYLHEMVHAATMPYVSGMGRRAFDDKMQRNELEASTLSEIQVYFEMPGLRELAFPHEIYADRFLTDPSMQALWRTNPQIAIETIRTMRRDVMVGRSEHLLDKTEQWIRRFAEQNAAYSITWSDRYDEIEDRMAKFQFEASCDRLTAIESYRDWLMVEAARDPVDNIPFRQEAELFTPFYWANKDKYTKAMS